MGAGLSEACLSGQTDETACEMHTEPSRGSAEFFQQSFPLPSEEQGRVAEERFALGSATAPLCSVSTQGKSINEPQKRGKKEEKIKARGGRKGNATPSG